MAVLFIFLIWIFLVYIIIYDMIKKYKHQKTIEELRLYYRLKYLKDKKENE